jgi:hypothetical protein
LCEQIKNSNPEKIWNIEWLQDCKLKEIICDADIVDRERLESMANVIAKDEFDIFEYME